ncbi:MAG: DNA-binding response regulator [Alphaproteobacteria bacterium]|nr:MAG: DNA-binding response regulator [Alphaproteobacteria bacterium]
MHVVLVEDQPSLRRGIVYRLEDEGFAVDALDDGEEADSFLRSHDCDVAILDINLPGASGLDVLRALRARGDPRPVILLTARDAVGDRVAGLDAGADDYLVKPFAMDELVARLRALARRRAVAPTRAVVLGPLTLELEPPVLRAPSGPLAVPRRELSLLATLAEAPGRPVPKERLLTRSWGTGADVTDKAVEVYVSRLRRRLAPFGVSIRTARGIGYVLEPPQ